VQLELAQGHTRVEQVIGAIQQRIDRRLLVPGSRLPSVRAMATTTGFSKSTIVEAYDRLAAEGVIRARAGSGFFVAAPLAPLALAEVAPRADPEIDPMWMLRRSLETHSGGLMPGCGWLPESWLPGELLRKGLRTIARAAPDTTVMGYGPAIGAEPLRRIIAHRMAEQGIEASPDQVMLTESGTHAMDLICRFLIEPGDTVLVDDPGYFNFIALLRAHRATVIGVPYTPHGPDMAQFAALLAEHRPRLYITNSAIHNPTGASLSAVNAHRILKLAELHDLLIVEDDIFADFEHTPGPRLAAFDGLDRVIRIGSFSKTLSSAVRCGHIAARPDWIGALVDLRIATAMSPSPFAAELIHTMLVEGAYRRHVDALRRQLEQAMSHAIGRLRTIGIEPWHEPAGGLFVWGRLPDGLCAVDITRRALEQDVVLAPGNVFSLSQTADRYFRFNVAMMRDDRVYRVLEGAMAGA
jgi:DNA-binding transcriptional MocR family regulator